MRHWNLLLIALLFGLSGCVSTTKPQDPQVLSATHGFVFVHFPRIHPTLSLKSLSTNKIYKLRDNRNLNTSSFWLPFGEYELKKLSYHSDPISSKEIKLAGYPKIIIKNGAITNLGSLINFNLGQGKEIWLPISSTESQRLVNLEIKQSNFLKNNEILQWEPINLPDISKGRHSNSDLGLIADLGLAYTHYLQEGELKEKLLSIDNIESFYNVMIKLLPPITEQEPSYDTEGNLYLGADLGQIKKRSPKGLWTSIDTGTLATISKVYWYQDSLFAVSGKNKVLVRKAENLPWQEYTQVDSSQTIYDLDGIKDDLIVLSAINETSNNSFILGENYTLSVYRVSLKNPINIKLINTIKQEGDVLINPKGIINNEVYYLGLMPDIFKSVNLETMKWHGVKIPQKFSSFHVAKSNLITLLNAQGAFSDLFISDNNGDSWQELNAPSYIIQDVFFSDNSNGFASRLNVGAFSAEHVLQQYNTNQDTWHDVTQAPETCKYIFARSIEMPILCLTKSDTMMSFKDNKWHNEVTK